LAKVRIIENQFGMLKTMLGADRKSYSQKPFHEIRLSTIEELSVRA
jgi:hypothetical protein